MYKNKDKEELLYIKNVNTRSRAAPLFKMVVPSCEKYKHSASYHGAISWTLLPVNIKPLTDVASKWSNLVAICSLQGVASSS